MEPKDLYVEQVLENMFDCYDWSRSFHTRQILVYDEVLPSDLLIIIHKWLRRKCADIENISLVVTHHLGLCTWWKNWCDLNHEKSFSIKEILFTNSPNYNKKWFQNIPPLPSIDWYKHNKLLSTLLSFYGGGYSKNDRIFLILKILEFADVAEIDYLGKFPPKQSILDYVESIFFFKNQKEIDNLTLVYDKHVRHDMTLHTASRFNHLKIHDEGINWNARQWEIDRHCWASVVRETSNDDFYTCVTEKTLRAFLHHVAVIPVGFRAVRELEKLGFWFPHDVVDYSYQDLKLFSDRVNGMIDSIRILSANWSFDQLNDFYLKHIDKFQHNAKLVFEYIALKESYT